MSQIDSFAALLCLVSSEMIATSSRDCGIGSIQRWMPKLEEWTHIASLTRMWTMFVCVCVYHGACVSMWVSCAFMQKCCQWSKQHHLDNPAGCHTDTRVLQRKKAVLPRFKSSGGFRARSESIIYKEGNVYHTYIDKRRVSQFWIKYYFTLLSSLGRSPQQHTCSQFKEPQFMTWKKGQT